MNPPFPYKVIITRRLSSSDPFKSGEESFQTIYDGMCDYENNRYPLLRDGVQLDKYNMYISDRMLPVKKQDLIELHLLNGEVINGVIVDYNPTNLGLTIKWDIVNN